MLGWKTKAGNECESANDQDVNRTRLLSRNDERRIEQHNEHFESVSSSGARKRSGNGVHWWRNEIDSRNAWHKSSTKPTTCEDVFFYFPCLALSNVARFLTSGQTPECFRYPGTVQRRWIPSTISPPFFRHCSTQKIISSTLGKRLQTLKSMAAPLRKHHASITAHQTL